MDNTRPVRTNTADRAPCMSMTQRYVRILVCTVCFQWNIHTNPVHSSVHRVVTTHYGAGGYPQRTIKLRVAWQVMGNTRPVRRNTADRAPNMSMTHRYVRILVCTVCFEWNIHANPVHSSVHRVETTHYAAGGYLQRTIICLRSDGQHAPRAHKHCRPCATHARDTRVRARTCWYGLF